MKVMVIVKANAESEAGQMPSQEELAAMGEYNQALVDAGVTLAGEGLHPSSRGVRVRFDGESRIVTDGPFAETRELIAGFWIWQVASMDEAVAWLKRAPWQGGEEVEIRPLFDMEDFGEAFTPELRAQEEQQRATLAARQR